MPKNRLQLNFQLESAADRAAFVQEYLNTIDFEPNEYELETISNYILWGKNDKGQNSQQEGIVELKKWAPQPVESLDGLIETPGFAESSVRSLREPQTRIPRTVFNRATALERAPEHLRAVYKDLFREIDTLELTLNYYELFCGKRKLPPREQLIARFSEDEQTRLNERALHLSQYKYLKMKHLLVELRAQQYTYYDTFNDKVRSHVESIEPVLEDNHVRLDEDVFVYPAGLKTDSALSRKIFSDLAPSMFNEHELQKISDLLWRRPIQRITLDFTNPEHIYHLYCARADLRDAQAEDPYAIYGAAAPVVNTLAYYEERANLSELQQEILNRKLRNEPNASIASAVNARFGKSYNENYISTIFRQKIIPQIADAARVHREILENIFYPENFKRCKDCGRVLLLSSDNFVKQKKSSDGFSPRCKACEKIKRRKYNEANRAII